MTAQSNPSGQRTKGTLLLALVFVAFLALMGRLIHIDTVQSAHLKSIAKRQQESRSVLPARRGNIVDRRGRILATTQVLPDVFVDGHAIQDVEAFCAELSARINVPADRIRKRMEARPNSRFVVVAKQVDPITAEAVSNMTRPGAGLSRRPARTYPMGTSLAHVLGFVGTEGHGLEGIELALDKHLAGRDGRIESIRDATRRALWHGKRAGRLPVDGGNLVLTIDAEIQRITEDALKKSVTSFEAERGVAIVMEPATGAVVAMACYPTFDPNDPMRVSANTRRNRVITDPVEPGSTFKPFIASGALANQCVTLTEKIDCHMGKHYFGTRLVSDTHAYGMLNLTGIITKSSNIAMGQIAQRMGNSLLHKTMTGFGFGSRTGIELSGESPGVVRPLAQWDGYSTVSVSYGYEVMVTPIQLIAGLCCLANDGIRVTPHLVQALQRADGTVIQSHQPSSTVRRATPADVARYMTRTAMVSVVENGGSGRHFRGPYRVFGKTGTVKLLTGDRRVYDSGAFLSSFMGAGPVGDPRLAALVMVRRPNMKKGYYGATVAAPAVSAILEAALAYWHVPADRKVAMRN